MIYDEYETYVKEYKAKFGDRVVVLYECGSFFEIYDDGAGVVDIKDISDKLNIIVSRRNKSITEVSRSNCLMAGFPSHCLKKFVGILLSYNHIIVLVTQTTPPPNPKRAVTDVLSPGVNLDVQCSDTCNTMVVFVDRFERYKQHGTDTVLGVSIVDVTTGRSLVGEVSSFGKDPSYPLDELHRLCLIHMPKEINICSVKKLEDKTLEKIKSAIGCNCLISHNVLESIIEHTSYQHKVFDRCYQDSNGLLNSLEYLGLEKHPTAAKSFTRLIEYIYMHNEKVLGNLSKPQCLDSQTYMLLSDNAVEQLDIINTSMSHKTSSLLSLLDNCKTAMGRRYFRNRLLNPYIDNNKISELYDKVEDALKDDITPVRCELGKIYDIERLWRKVYLGHMSPCEFQGLYESILVSCNLLGKDIITIDPSYHINNERLHLYTLDTIDHDMFHEHHTEFKEIHANIKQINQSFADVLQQLNVNNEQSFKLESNDKDGVYISTTPKKWKEHTKKHGCSGFQHKQLTTTVKIYHDSFMSLNEKLALWKGKGARLALKLYKEFLSDFAERYDPMIKDLIEEVSTKDYIYTLAYNACKYRLTKPTVTKGGAFVKAQGLRHLLVETNQIDIEYTTNDISLGTHDTDGMLLYGINSAGKSSLMKSVGLVVIMAQAGMYVPCDHLEYAPFTRVFTRITSSDDIIRGHSTFTKEMLELRNILSRADENSLVIGDELCSGTESISAVSIVSAGLVTLHNKTKSKFVFATHLHDLVDVPEIKDLAKLKVYHLSVTYDEGSKLLIYDRKLKEGNGSTLYGIEVCKSLDMSNDFLDIANKVRHRITGTDHGLVAKKKSSYNSQVIVDKCMLCLQKIASEVHHIKEQNEFDSEGHTNNNKNAKFNLIPVCNVCHNSIHHGNKHVYGFVQTSEGKKLGQVPTDDIIHAYHLLLKSGTKKHACDVITEKFNISKYKLNKLVEQTNNSYEGRGS